MSRIGNSPVAAICDLRFEPFPTKPRPIAKVVHVSGVTIGVTAQGVIYSSEVRKACHYSHDYLHRTLAGCIKLGLLSEAALKEHKDYSDAQHRASMVRYHVGEVIDAAKPLGLKLTASQKAKLFAALGEKTTRNSPTWAALEAL